MTLKIGVSACLLGNSCNFNGNDLLSVFVKRLPTIVPIEYISFCPEDQVFGTPRPNLRILGGHGDDVLDGHAKVIDENDKDVTEQQILGAKLFLNRLQNLNVTHAILMDGSPSCGSNVLLKEELWPRDGFKRGVGVACALLKRNGITVLSSFDERSISDFIKTTFPDSSIEGEYFDLKEMSKFKMLFDC